MAQMNLFAGQEQTQTENGLVDEVREGERGMN